MTRGLLRLGFAVVLALALGLGIGIGLQFSGLRLPGVPRSGSGGSAAAPVEEMQRAFVRVSERVRPAVVNIATSHFLRRQRPVTPEGGPSFREFYDRFFGQMP